jgi:NTE family protein
MSTTRALVLGGGGVVGTAWMTGLVSGLRQEGVDLAEADVIVGTSAGSIVGTKLATGQDLDSDTPAPSADQGDSAPKADRGRMTEAFAILADASLEPADARRRVGRLALAAGTINEHAHIARMGFLIGAREWPARTLLITAVDIETGEPQIWDRASGAPLPAAVASSCAMPGLYPPITINGRRYMDGALRSGTNADLAAGARVLVVIEPVANMFPASPLQPGAGTVLRIIPDSATLAAFGPDLSDRAAWTSAYQAGVRQAAEAAQRVRATWHDGAASGPC